MPWASEALAPLTDLLGECDRTPLPFHPSWQKTTVSPLGKHGDRKSEVDYLRCWRKSTEPAAIAPNAIAPNPEEGSGIDTSVGLASGNLEVQSHQYYRKVGSKASPFVVVLLWYFGYRWVGYSTTLKTQSSKDNAPWKLKLWGWSTGKLVQVKTSSNKYQRNQNFRVLNCTVGHTGTRLCNESKAWGQNHLSSVRATKLGKWTGWSKNLRPSRAESVNRITNCVRDS